MSISPLKQYAGESRRILDKIVFSITTDGTISPGEALRQAAAILCQQFMVFRHPFVVPEKPAHLSDIRIPRYICLMDREDLDLSVRTYNVLKRNGIRSVAQILEMGEEQLTTIRNFGQKGLQDQMPNVFRRVVFYQSKRWYRIMIRKGEVHG